MTNFFKSALFTAVLLSVPGSLASEWVRAAEPLPGDDAVPIMKLPLPKIETLPNGLQIAWFLDDRLPVIDLALLIQSGNRDDPRGKSGTAELLGSVLERGAGGLTARQIAKAIEGLGASRYSSADEDSFSVGMHGLAPDAPILLEYISKIALHPDFIPAEVTREKLDLVERWNHIGDSADPLASIAFYRKVAAGTSYGRGGVASLREFEKVKREDLIAFHKKHFTPKNALLMVVGRVNSEEFKKRIETLFGDWKGEAPVRDYRPYTDNRIVPPAGSAKAKQAAKEILIVNRPGLTQSQVRLGFKSISVRSPERYPLTVANALLGEYFNSRLNAVIRDQLGLTYGIESGFAYSQDLTRFGISSATQTENTGKVIAKTLEILKAVKGGDISEEEVKLSKQYLVGGYPLSVSTLGAVATRWATGYLFKLGPEYLNEFSSKIGAVTRPEVVESVAKNFDLDHLTIVVAGDAEAIKKSLKASGFTNLREIPISALK
ncbi:MAG: insulinase family protein [Methylotenera sp.]|nr:insulinase family protein [Oligoflexia bacterium]